MRQIILIDTYVEISNIVIPQACSVVVEWDSPPLLLTQQTPLQLSSGMQVAVTRGAFLGSSDGL